MLTWEQIQFEHELIKRMPWTFKNLTIKILQTKYCKMCEKFSLEELASIEFDMLFDFVLFCFVPKTAKASKCLEIYWSIIQNAYLSILKPWARKNTVMIALTYE